MTVGIYKLNFIGTDKVYIGQSVNIEKRFKEHLNMLSKGLGKPKLQEAYNTYGIPTLEILVDDITESELDAFETEAIIVYDSVNTGFNTLNTPGNPDIRGYLSVHAKLSKEDYINIFELLANTELTIKNIASKLNTTKDIVNKIFTGSTHNWLYEDYPDLGKIILHKRELGRYYRKSYDDSNRKLIAPDGSTYMLTNIREFCREHNLSSQHISAVLRGDRKSHKGWKKYE